MNLVELSVGLMLGLVSSLHCVQMCGPLVISFSLPMGERRRVEQIIAHLAYQGGRIVTYTILGGVAGLAGHSLRILGDLAGFQNLVSLLSGGLMVIAGLVMVDLIPLDRLTRLAPESYATRLFRTLGRRISATDPGSKFVLGVMLGLMPCGLIYAALIKAISTGGVFAGALTMTAFGFGTAGSLLLLGLFSSTVMCRPGRQRWSPRVTALSVMLVGALLIYRGLANQLSAIGGPFCHTD